MHVFASLRSFDIALELLTVDRVEGRLIVGGDRGWEGLLGAVDRDGNRLKSDLTEAMRSRDQIKVATLRMGLTAVRCAHDSRHLKIDF